jgi:hypothetical protein
MYVVFRHQAFAIDIFISTDISPTLAMSPSNFQLIIDAFDNYAKEVGIDLTKNPLADSLRDCDSSNAVLELLQGKAQEFKSYRDGDRKLISWLKPVVEVVHGFSGVLGQAISLVSRFLVVFFSTHLPSGAVSSSECDICQRRCSPFGMYPVRFSSFVLLISRQIRRPSVSAQATMRSSTCLNASKIS